MSSRTTTDVVAISGQRRALIGTALSQLLVLTLWFSAAAVAPQLREQWGLSVGESSWLTLAVQIGFVVGALAIAISGLADSVAARKLFTVAALVGAVSNLAVISVTGDSVALAYVVLFMTGVALAGVYPSGMKAMAGWFQKGRGMVLGVLVGALTVGSAAPHLIRGLGLDWRGVLIGASILAVTGAVLMISIVSDGPFEVPSSLHAVTSAVTNSGS